MFDITTQAVAEMTAVHLKGPDGNHLYTADGKPVRIVVYGPGSKPFAEIEARQSNRVMKRRADNDGKAVAASPEQAVADQADDLAAITVAFENLTYPPAGEAQGQALYRALYADRSLGFIAQQIWRACQDWASFRSASPAT